MGEAHLPRMCTSGGLARGVVGLICKHPTQLCNCSFTGHVMMLAAWSTRHDGIA